MIFYKNTDNFFSFCLISAQNVAASIGGQSCQAEEVLEVELEHFVRKNFYIAKLILHFCLLSRTMVLSSTKSKNFVIIQ